MAWLAGKRKFSEDAIVSFKYLMDFLGVNEGLQNQWVEGTEMQMQL